MAWIAVTGSLVFLNLPPSSHPESSSNTVRSNSAAPLFPSHQNPNFPIVFTALALAFGFLLHLLRGNFWSKFYAWVTHSSQWDPHGFSANDSLKLNKLSRFKKYKVSQVILFDKNMNGSIGTDDPFNEKFSLRPGGIYTKAQLQKELNSLSNCGLFEKVDIEANAKPDGTIGIKISFAENTWQISDGFRCINVGLLPATKDMEIREDMTEKEEKEYYKRRMDMARPCLLPPSIHEEVLKILGEGKLTARMLEKIRNKVEKWYQDNGYVCAQVVNFENLNSREIICEVVEGDITQLVLQFQDKLGNACEGNTQFGVVKKKLLEHLGQGKPFNIEEGKQVLRKINSLALFSTIDVIPLPDAKNMGGIMVDVILKELDEQSAQVLGRGSSN